MKIRYTRQYDNFRCGPVAIANVIKWSGRSFSFKEAKKHLDKLCKCTKGFKPRTRKKIPYSGTTPKDLNAALQKVSEKNKLSITCKHRPTLKEIENHLKKGVLLFRYYWGPKNGHYFLVLEQSPYSKSFKTINLRKDATYSWERRENFKNNVLKKRRDKLIVWFIEKP